MDGELLDPRDRILEVMSLAGVMMVTGEYPPYSTGGLGTHVASLTKACTRRGVTVDVTAPGYGRGFALAKTERWEFSVERMVARTLDVYAGAVAR